MTFPYNLAVIGTPRSGSSYLTKVLVSNGFQVPEFGPIQGMEISQFNPDGYFESKFLNLLNDQIIRSVYGSKHSFLYPPKVKFYTVENLDPAFSFDLSEDTIQIPEQYLENIRSFTGQDWDVWGLTRMQSGSKWHRIYETLGINSHEGLRRSIGAFNDYLANRKGLILKDSRLNFTFNLFRPNVTKVISLHRDESGLTKSIQNHFGPRIFTQKVHEPFDWVSNHFNYQVNYMAFSEYSSNYQNAVDHIKNDVDLLELDQNSLDSPETLSALSKFLGFPLKVN